MLPLFKAGQVVLVSPASPCEGDCGIYDLEGRTLLHRAVKTVPGGVWFADDAGRLDPHYVPLAAIRGRVLCKNPLASGIFGLIYSKCRSGLFKLFTNA